MIWVMIRAKNEPSEILVRGEGGGEQSKLHVFLKPEISIVGNESECKSQVRIYAIVLVVATAHTKDNVFQPFQN